MALTQQHLKPISSSSSSSLFHLLNPSTLPPPPFSVKTHSDSLFFFRPRTVQSLHNSAPTFTRRLFLPSVSSIWDALTGGTNNAREAVMAIRRGMSLFRQGDVLGSVVEFDKAIELDPRQKIDQAGKELPLGKLELEFRESCTIELQPGVFGFNGDPCEEIEVDFSIEEGAEQFRLDVAQNPNDTEESIWCFLCEAQLYGVDGARKQFLEVGRDPRPVMREAYDMFKDGGDPEKLVAAFSNGRENEFFYASLYAGLYYESQKKADEAKVHLLAACQSPYGQMSDDYMASLAKVHCLCRNWSSA